MLRIPQVAERIGLSVSRTYIVARQKDFPPPRKVAGTGSSSCRLGRAHVARPGARETPKPLKH